MTDRCAIVNASVRAERVDADEEVEVGGDDAARRQRRRAIMMTTYGVERVGCRRPTALGIWRFVASE